MAEFPGEAGAVCIDDAAPPARTPRYQITGIPGSIRIGELTLRAGTAVFMLSGIFGSIRKNSST